MTETAQSREDMIRHRAYCLWQEAGAPEGDDWSFWLQAEQEVSTDPVAAPAAAAAPAPKPKAASKPKVPKSAAAAKPPAKPKAEAKPKAAAKPKAKAPSASSAE